MKNYDAIIIGAGVIGSAIAFELSKKGYAVLSIDKNSDAGTGSTAGSCAIVRAHYSTYEGVAMAYEGFSYFAKWNNYLGVTDPTGMARYMNCGSVLLKTRGHDYQKVVRNYEAVGVPYEDWDIDELNMKVPIYTKDSYWPPSRPEDDPDYWKETPVGTIDGALYVAEAGYVDDPQLATHNLIHAAKSHGAQTLYDRRVTEIRRDGDTVKGITFDDGQSFDAAVVVNAAGPHSFVINRLAGVEEGMNIKTRAIRHEVHHVPSPTGFDFEQEGIQTADADNGVYFRPCKNNTILVGSEDPKCDPAQDVEDPDDFDRNITDVQWTAQVSRLCRRIPELAMPEEKMGFAELYDVSDDWIPIYDKSDLKGFYLAIGTSGNQFKNAPVVGYVMSELIDRCEKGQDHDRDPVKVTSVYKKLELDMGFYSRKREINKDSSFSVNG